MNPLNIIAEAGTNHNGNIKTAKELVLRAKKAGADSVKFQIIYPETLYVAKMFKNGVLEDNPVIEQRSRTALNDEHYRELATYCREQGISFTASVFNRHGVDLLCALEAPFIKIASTDLNNLNLLRYAAKTGKKLVISTGLSTMEEILRSVSEVEKAGCHDMILMHCVSVYPTSFRQANLQFIDQLKEQFAWPIGYSDHTPNSLAAVIALSKGCTWFEKHITLDKTQQGFDHNYALEPDEFAQFTRDLQDAEEACAFHQEKLSDAEKQVSQRARRSLYAARDMAAGEVLEEQDILVVRPSGSFSAADIDRLVGRQLGKDIRKYENITPGHLS